MKKIFLILLSFNLFVNAECFSKTQINNYEGNIGKYPIKLSLSKKDNKIKGEYFYISQLKDINISADIDEDGNIIINEYDKKKNITAQFIGKWDKKSFKKNYCSKATGIWKDNKGKEYPFSFQSRGRHIGMIGDRYGWIGIGDDKAFEEKVYTFWKGVKEDNKKEVAKYMHYPLYKYDLTQEKFISVNNEKEFIENYNKIITEKAKKDIINSIPKYMFTTDEGAMLGQGYIWFNSYQKIVAINSSHWNRNKIIPKNLETIKFNIITCTPELNHFSINGKDLSARVLEMHKFLKKIKNKPIDDTLDTYTIYDYDHNIYECNLKGVHLKFQITDSLSQKGSQHLKVWENDILTIDLDSFNKSNFSKNINQFLYSYQPRYPDDVFLDNNYSYIYLWSVPPNWNTYHRTYSYTYTFQSFRPRGGDLTASSKGIYKRKKKYYYEKIDVINDQLLQDMKKIALEKDKNYKKGVNNEQ